MLCVVGVWFPSEPAACWVSLHEKERKKEEKSPGMFIQVRTHLGHTQEKERERERDDEDVSRRHERGG